jgi:hypothetical protein
MMFRSTVVGCLLVSLFVNTAIQDDSTVLQLTPDNGVATYNLLRTNTVTGWLEVPLYYLFNNITFPEILHDHPGSSTAEVTLFPCPMCTRSNITVQKQTWPSQDESTVWVQAIYNAVFKMFGEAPDPFTNSMNLVRALLGKKGTFATCEDIVNIPTSSAIFALGSQGNIQYVSVVKSGETETQVAVSTRYGDGAILSQTKSMDQWRDACQHLTWFEGQG